jgi:hypothetical protein
VALQPFVVLGQWGTTGSGNGQFQDPSDVGVDPSGNVFVLDRVLGKVQQFTTAGTFVKSWTKGCKTCTPLANPDGIAAGTGVVWVADTGNQRLVKFDTNGVQQLVVPTPAPGQPGAFSTAFDVDVDRAGNVYVVSGAFKPTLVQVFTAAGAYLRTLTPAGNLANANGAGAVTVDEGLNVYAVVTPAGGSIAVAKWDRFGVASGSFSVAGAAGTPGISVDSQRRLYVSNGSGTINLYSTSGTLLGSFGTLGSGQLQFNNPEVAAPDTFDVLYVADRNNDRVVRVAESATLTVRITGLAPDVVPGAAFTVTGPSVVAPFTLDNATATPTPDVNTTTGLVPGSYVVQNPANVAGHLPTSVSCSNGQAAGGGITSLAVSVKAGANVTCTYVYTWIG